MKKKKPKGAEDGKDAKDDEQGLVDGESCDDCGQLVSEMAVDLVVVIVVVMVVGGDVHHKSLTLIVILLLVW